MTPDTVTNARIAAILDQVADRLEEQRANPFRVDAYRAGARVVAEHPQSVQELALRAGPSGLDALPHIGPSLAAAIDEIAHTGRLRRLQRLEGAGSPVEVLMQVPGIGPRLAERLYRELHVDTLEALEAAAHDGSLATVHGLGPRRIEGIGAVLEILLSRSDRRGGRRIGQPDRAPAERPTVARLLAVDAEYRDGARRRSLPTIAPLRNNPEQRRWLPVLHTEADHWHFTALFSNSDRAHALARTRDWVVVYYDRDGAEDQCTIVTEYHGPLAGKRVVRGREDECADHYRNPARVDEPPG